MSHDDTTTEQRRGFAELGVAVAEFPLTEEVAQAAARDGAPIAFGAPNVLRGGSHTGCPDAALMVDRGWCSVLASDYYYPALLQAPFVLERKRALLLERTWSLVSSAAAEAVGLSDRGVIETGKRADLVLVDPAASGPAHVVATIVGGQVVYLADSFRLHG